MSEVRDAYVVNREELAVRGEFEGHEQGGTGISIIFVDAAPGGRQIEAGPGDIVVVPAGMPHGFVNSGEGQLRQIDIHLSPRYVTEWLG